MSDSFLLHEADMLRDSHFPVVAFFGEISGEMRFLRIIGILSESVGYGCNYAVCTFPDDIEAEAEKFGDGVEFSLHSGESVVLSYEEFYWYLAKACENYLKKYDIGAGEIQSILAKVRQRYNIAE